MILPKYTSYHKLTAYQKAKKLVLLIYQLTSKFPKPEIYGLTSQMRRAVISILANIVEGYSKESTTEYAHFFDIAVGSLTELEIYLEISLELKYLTREEEELISSLLIEVKKLLYSYKISLRQRAEAKKRA